ncbi:MAG: hypothetical protein ACREQL_05115 [Candidatus Binatia bacterium]
MAVAPAPKPYLYADELAALTPWTAEAIKKKVQRGELRRNLHYFQEQHRDRLIFKWDAIVELIERGAGDHAAEVASSHVKGKRIDVEKATATLRKLFD